VSATVKPGTRCECWGKADHKHKHRNIRCDADAVRMVTVREPQPDRKAISDPPVPREWDVPMCAACAEYHANRP